MNDILVALYRLKNNLGGRTMGKYWLSEEPKIIDLGNRQIRLFPKAEKVQFCKTYEQDGEKKIGGVVSLDYEIFQFDEVKAVLKDLMMEV